ncbi:hypothetical protein BDW02DRAFT_187883 [Decorospora gaudefroyi]|uniref:NB-ARC domain-containing protein n=1 Tax=Decorospora gaudefroyi TaxID=184978 RepID=A0A6A5KPI4_9PLEO|nr:hypothetical protein BDW02DRAFT_187883 [Decorospora gaudefroyi]
MNDVMTRCQPGTKLALMGIGGVGKSRIAIEYSYRIRKSSPETWVFWVSADSPTSVAQDFRKIAKAVGIPGWDEKATDIFTLVRDWLKEEANGPWIMILDNVDNADVLTAPAPRVTPLMTEEDDDEHAPIPQIREFLTTSPTGSILITSRNTEAAQMLTGNCAYHIAVEEMSETEAITLLQSKLSTNVLYTATEAAALVQTVDYMPLAISQIATNISINYPRLTLSRATQNLQSPSSDAATAQLLESSVHESSRDIRRSNSIVKTWHLSFQYVREAYPSAARLLSLMCLFDRQGIPEALLARQYGAETVDPVAMPFCSSVLWWIRRRLRLRLRLRRKRAATTGSKVYATSSFDDDWRVLTNFALIKTDVDRCHFRMHRLVQYTTRRWLEIHGELRAWMRKYVNIMKDHFPRPEYDNWKVCQYLFPHAQQTLSYKPTATDEALHAWAPLLYNVATYANYIGNCTAAETLSRAVFNFLTASLDAQNIQTLKSAQLLGEALERLHRNPEAEAMYKRTAHGLKTVLGDCHPDTLDTLNCLGRVLRTQSKTDESDRVYQQRIHAKIHLLGIHDPSTRLSLSGSAIDFFSRGMFAEAEAIHRLSLATATRRAQSEEEAVYHMGMLATCLKAQNKFLEAESLPRHASHHHHRTPSSIQTNDPPRRPLRLTSPLPLIRNLSPQSCIRLFAAGPPILIPIPRHTIRTIPPRTNSLPPEQTQRLRIPGSQHPRRNGVCVRRG